MEGAAPSRTFGRYRILEKLGVGGMGTVHLAKKEGARELCVLKQMLADNEEESESTRRFKREAHLVSHLDDPRIARILDAGHEEGSFYIAFEFIAGQTLARLLGRLQENKRWLTSGAAIQIALEVLAGLAYAHTKRDPEGRPLNLVHRDLSPANIMIGYDGSVKIIDFGIATSRVDDFRTTPGRFVGTVRYMSPEQALSKPLDLTSDVYTLSAVLWEMLARRRLIPKLPLQEMIEAIVWKATDPLASVAPQVPPAVAEVVQRGLQKVATNRWQTAEDMAAALFEAAHGLDPYDRARLGELMQSEFGAEKIALERRLDVLLDEATDETDFRQIAATAVRAPAPDPSSPDWDEPQEPTKPDAMIPAEPTELEPTRTATPQGDAMIAASPMERTRIAVWPEPGPRPSTPTQGERPSIAQPIRKRSSRAPMIAAGLLVVIAGALTVVVGSMRSDQGEGEDPVEVPVAYTAPTPAPIEIRARQAPTEAAQGEPASEERRAPKGTPKLQRKEPPAAPPKIDPPPATRSPDTHEAIRQKLRRLEATPGDSTLFIEVHRELLAAASKLPPGEARGIRLDLDAALRSGSVEALSKALERISRAPRTE